MQPEPVNIEFLGYKIPFKWMAFITCLIITFITCFSVVNNGWVNWDDSSYVLDNELVQTFSWDQIKAIITTKEVQGNYHPITVISLAIDYAFAGDQAYIYHLHSFILHLANTGLVFLLFLLLSKRAIIAFIVALLFGIHPMHIESVAWISSRKDLLSGFYFLVATICWFFYLKRDTQKHIFYLAAIIAFTLALLSKTVVVFFPMVLILIDYLQSRKINRATIFEKIPFFLLSIIFGLLAAYVQKEVGAVSDAESYSFIEAVFIASTGLFHYIVKVIAPIQLSTFHPYPSLIDGWPWYFYVSFFLTLVGFVFLVLKGRKNKPLIFGVLFFLFGIGPMLQLLPVGSAIIAERYTYLPYLGLFYLLAFYLNNLFINGKINIKSLTYIGGVLVVILCYLSINRIQVWKNGETLWSDVIEKYPEDYFGYLNRGNYYFTNNDFESAEQDLIKSSELAPQFYGAFNSLGLIYLRQQNFQAAEKSFSQAIKLNNSDYKLFLNRGIVNRETDKIQQSISDLNQAELMSPNVAMIYMERGTTYMNANAYKDAIKDFTAAIKLEPDKSNYYYYRGDAYCYNAQFNRGINDFSTAISINPNDARVYFGRSRAFLSLNNKTQAYEDAIRAKNLGYRLPEGYLNLFNQ